MKNKIVITAILIILVFAVFCGSTNAATIFTDDFEDYDVGLLGGQGGWVIPSYHLYKPQVQSSYVKQGGKAIKVYGEYLFSYGAEKTGTPTNDGMITIYVEKFIGGTSTPDSIIELKEGNTVVVSMRSAGSFFRYFDGGLGGYVNIYPPFFSYKTWYAVQIQWRSSDHKIRYNINGIQWTDWKKGMNEWTTGLDTVALKAQDGWIYYDAIQENLIPDRNPVLIVPGLLGTEMKKGEELLWLNPAMVNPFNDDSFMDPLQFSDSLLPIDAGVDETDVIGSKTLGPITFDYTEGLINEFAGQGYVEGESLFTFPYDWRYGVSGVYEDGRTNADLLAEKINEILQQTGAEEVDIVAHSLGGLIVKKYAMDNPSDNHIGKSVFVGVPNTGAPKAVKVLLQGDNFGVLGLSDQEMKKIAENLPSGYDLLPSQEYYNTLGESFIQVIDRTSLFGTEIRDLNYEESESFLTDDHSLNSTALQNSESLHVQAFDDFDLRTADIDLYSINGCKAGTLGKVREVRIKDIFGNIKITYEKPEQVPGDGTVPFESATNLPIDQQNKYYALSADHGKMPSQNGIRQQIVNIITGSELDTGSDLFGNELISQDLGQCELNGKAIEVFSPIDIFVTDQFGNTLGLSEDGSIINEIPNADFEVWGEHKFIYLPSDSQQDYAVSLQGTDTGTYTIKTNIIQNTEITQTEVFSNLPVTPELLGQVNLSAEQTTLSLDTDGDGSTDQIVEPSAVLDSQESEDLTPPETQVILTGKEKKDGSYGNDVLVELQAADNLSGVLKTWYSLDGVDFSEYTEPFILEKKDIYELYYYSTDRAGNNEEVDILDILAGIKQKQL